MAERRYRWNSTSAPTSTLRSCAVARRVTLERMRGLLVVVCLVVGCAARRGSRSKEPRFLAGYRGRSEGEGDREGAVRRPRSRRRRRRRRDHGRRLSRQDPPRPASCRSAKYRKHLEWVAAALHAIDAFFASCSTRNAELSLARAELRFVRSVGKRTPSAYATGWTITHNVEGSLLTSERGVRETLFHELFHLNDFDHGDWSAKTLAERLRRDREEVRRREGDVPRAVRAERHEGPRDRHVLRVPAEQRRRGARVRRRARGPLLQGADARCCRDGKLVAHRVQVRACRERARVEGARRRVLRRVTTSFPRCP